MEIKEGKWIAVFSVIALFIGVAFYAGMTRSAVAQQADDEGTASWKKVRHEILQEFDAQWAIMEKKMTR